MSQKATRKPLPEEKDKNHKSDISPVMEVKKKPNQPATSSSEKPVEKPENKAKPAEQHDSKAKPAEKTIEKGKPVEKPIVILEKMENKAKPAEKAVEKPKEKAGEKMENKAKPAEKAVEKPKEKAGEKSGDKNPIEKEEKKENGPESEKADNNAKQNGSKSNGSTAPNPNPTTNGNGSNCVVEIDSSDDEQFPELTYDDSDIEPVVAGAGRSATRRDQVKASRTPETPRPASSKDIVTANNSNTQTVTPKHSDDNSAGKDKVLQMKDGVTTDRKLRSTDSPKPDTKKPETPKKETPKKDKKDSVKENGQEKEIEVVMEIDYEDEPEQRKTDTNFSKSRVKVSPYRRSGRLGDQTTTSIQANYTGNNTTMEMDITETSFAASEPSLEDSSNSYLNTIRNMRGRRSYKLLKDVQITHNRSVRSNASTSVTESSARPTAPVVGRKRKPEQDECIEVATEADESPTVLVQNKRMRLLNRIAQPFRRTSATAEIVGVNTDLPLTAPIAAPSMDPETLKTAPAASAILTNPSTPAAPAAEGKRCVIM